VKVFCLFSSSIYIFDISTVSNCREIPSDSILCLRLFANYIYDLDLGSGSSGIVKTVIMIANRLFMTHENDLKSSLGEILTDPV
jgi:hypothetical protein